MVLPPPLPSFQFEMFMWFASKNITYKQIGFTANDPGVPPILGTFYMCLPILLCLPFLVCLFPWCAAVHSYLRALPPVVYVLVCSSLACASLVCAPPLVCVLLHCTIKTELCQGRRSRSLTRPFFLNLIFLIYSKSSLPCIEEYYDCLNQIICFLF